MLRGGSPQPACGQRQLLVMPAKTRSNRALIAFTAAAPTARRPCAATRRGRAGQRTVQDGSLAEDARPPAPPSVHSVVADSMPGWQIILIAAGADAHF